MIVWRHCTSEPWSQPLVHLTLKQEGCKVPSLRNLHLYTGGLLAGVLLKRREMLLDEARPDHKAGAGSSGPAWFPPGNGHPFKARGMKRCLFVDVFIPLG